MKTLAEDKCFMVSETAKYEYYICKGVNDKVYDIIFYKALEKWKCDCNNVRNTPCYHIDTIKRLKEIETEVSKLKKKRDTYIEKAEELLDEYEEE